MTSQNSGKKNTVRSTIESFAILAAAILSIASIIISVLSFHRDSESQRIERNQNQAMRVVSANAVLLFNHLQTISVAQEHGVQVEPLLLVSLQKRASNLQDSMDSAIRHGLYTDLIGSHACAVSHYALLQKHLEHVNTLDPSSSDTLDWGRAELIFGALRLLDKIRVYDPPLMPDSVWREIGIKQEVFEQAWREPSC